VIEVAGDQFERIGVEDRQQLLVGEAEEVLELRRATQNSWFSPPKTSDTESSVNMRRIVSVRMSATLRTLM
jgi:hypothetical protein